jgi:WD40 repeat protein
MTIVEKAPLQIYCSALMFCPKESPLQKQFAHLIPPWISRLPRTLPSWNPNVQTLICDTMVNAMVLSADNHFLAFASQTFAPAKCSIRLWHPQSGVLCGILDCLPLPVNALAFSPGDLDGAVRLWNPKIRLLRGTLAGSSPVLHVAFSPDGQLLAAAS